MLIIFYDSDSDSDAHHFYDSESDAHHFFTILILMLIIFYDSDSEAHHFFTMHAPWM
jgi:hypothetical protein